MSARRSQIPLASNDQVMTELLQKLSDEIKESGKVRRGSSVKLIKKACKRIRMLNEEIENLSQKIAELVATAKLSKYEADIISKLLEQ